MSAKLPNIELGEVGNAESIIIDMLATDGPIYAYRRQASEEIGILRIVVEFCDVGSAHRAVSRLNGATVRVRVSVIFLRVSC